MLLLLFFYWKHCINSFFKNIVFFFFVLHILVCLFFKPLSKPDYSDNCAFPLQKADGSFFSKKILKLEKKKQFFLFLCYFIELYLKSPCLVLKFWNLMSWKCISSVEISYQSHNLVLWSHFQENFLEFWSRMNYE